MTNFDELRKEVDKIKQKLSDKKAERKVLLQRFKDEYGLKSKDEAYKRFYELSDKEESLIARKDELQKTIEDKLAKFEELTSND